MLKLNKTSHFLVFYVTLAVVFASVNALQCYACSYTISDESDSTCLTNLSAVRVINCTKKYCLTMRQELIHNANKVTSFLRDCQDKPIMLNGDKKDGSFRTFYRSCEQNLCNGHNGRVYNSSSSHGAAGAGAGAGAVGGGGTGGTGGGNHNAIIPGKNGCLGARQDSRIFWSSLLLFVISVKCMR